MGVDGLAMLLIILTTLLTPISILVSWDADPEARARILHLAAGAGNGHDRRVRQPRTSSCSTFSGKLMLVPMALLIGIWGSGNRVYAALKFFLYTLAGSLLMLVAIIALYLQHRAALGHPGRADRSSCGHGFSARLPDLGLPGLRGGVRGQGADVPVPYLAARRARAGAHGGLDHPGRRAAEDGRLRLHPLRPADGARRARRRWPR